jgi:ketosteroid isomerase-like protein
VLLATLSTWRSAYEGTPATRAERAAGMLLREREWTSRARTVSGDPYENQCAAVFLVRDGRIASVREYLDTLDASEVAFTTARGGQPYPEDSGCP